MLLCIVYAMLFVDSVDIYRENYWGYILAHKFLDIQPIFNPFEVLESSESGFSTVSTVLP